MCLSCTDLKQQKEEVNERSGKKKATKNWFVLCIALTLFFAEKSIVVFTAKDKANKIAVNCVEYLDLLCYVSFG